MAEAASVTEEPEVQSEEEKLKHLDLLEEAVQQARVYASRAYGYAKDKTGPLKPGVETIEGTLKTYVGPAYDKYNGARVVAVKFFDRKVDEVMPPFVKDVTNRAKSLSTNIVKNVGVVGTAKKLLVKIDPVAEKYASSAWKNLNHLPFVSTMAKSITPAATFVTDKYNKTVQEKASFLPLVPTEKIARVFTIPSDPQAEEPVVVPNEGEEAVEEVPRGEEAVAEENAQEVAGGGEEAVEET